MSVLGLTLTGIGVYIYGKCRRYSRREELEAEFAGIKMVPISRCSQPYRFTN